MENLKTIRGIKDITYPESHRWAKLIKFTEDIFESYGYRKIFLPVIEYTELFSRSIGEDTDIVSKEMYSFKDRKGRNLSLRPEGTAGVVRAMIENNLLQMRQKVYYFGPMFRYEKPQEGRYRQFYQLGCEAFGSSNPLQDAEIVEMAVKVILKCKVSEYNLLINSVGCEGCRKVYRKVVQDFLSYKEDELCSDCMRRLKTNTLRILDCKNKKCQQIYKELPLLRNYLCDECSDFYKEYEYCLRKRNIVYNTDDRMVRGLDYYTGPVFEIAVSAGTVVAGGRYNNLVKKLGGGDVPACGWALGVERLVSVSNLEAKNIPEVYMILLKGGGEEIFKIIADKLRDNGISVEENCEDIPPGRKFKMADKKKVDRVLIIGEEETKKNSVSIKNMRTGIQENLPVEDMDEIIRKVRC